MAEKMQANDIIVIKNEAVAKAKTKDYANLLKILKLANARVLFVFCGQHKNAVRSARNIKKVEAKLFNQVSVSDIMVAKKIIFCETAANKLLGGKK